MTRVSRLARRRTGQIRPTWVFSPGGGRQEKQFCFQPARREKEMPSDARLTSAGLHGRSVTSWANHKHQMLTDLQSTDTSSKSVCHVAAHPLNLGPRSDWIGRPVAGIRSSTSHHHIWRQTVQYCQVRNSRRPELAQEPKGCARKENKQSSSIPFSLSLLFPGVPK